MELWGFENSGLRECKFGLFLGEKPAGVAPTPSPPADSAAAAIREALKSKGKGKGAKSPSSASSSPDPVPPQRYHLSDLAKMDRRESADGTPEVPALVSFGVEDSSPAARTKKGQKAKTVDASRPQNLKGTIAYFVDKNKNGILDPEERESLDKNLQAQDPDRKWFGKDPNPIIYVLKPGKKGASLDDYEKIPYAAVESSHVEGMKGPGSGEEGSPGGFNLVDYNKSVEQQLRNLKDQNRKIDLLLMDLLAAIAMGNIDMILQVIRLFETQAGVNAAKATVMAGRAITNLNKSMEEISEKRQELLKKKLSGETQSEAEKLRNQEQMATYMRDHWTNSMRDSLSRRQEAQDLAASVAKRVEEISRGTYIWR